jgi:hypothetical protein
MRQLLAISLLAAMLSATLPVLAQTTETSAAPATETTTAGGTGTETSAAGGAPAETVETRPPAVPVVTEAPVEEFQPWTIRYLVPTSVILAGVLVFATVIQYFLRVVRGRYKTVE